MQTHKTASVIGALLGLVAFATVALHPALSFGRYAGELLAGGLFHGGLGHGLIGKLVVGFGSVLGLVAVASFFLVAGAVTGTLVKNLTVRLAAPAPSRQAAAQTASAPKDPPAAR